MKFETNKINLYLGIGYVVLGIISLFSGIQKNILLGLTVAGLCFSLSLLALAIENAMTPKKKVAEFVLDKEEKLPSENVALIKSMLYKKPKHSEYYQWVKMAGGICFMLGFILLVVLPGLSLNEDTINHVSGFSYIVSLGLVFISFFLEEKQSERTQRLQEKEMISYLFDQLESSCKTLEEKQACIEALQPLQNQPDEKQPDIPGEPQARHAAKEETAVKEETASAHQKEEDYPVLQEEPMTLSQMVEEASKEPEEKMLPDTEEKAEPETQSEEEKPEEDSSQNEEEKAASV